MCFLRDYIILWANYIFDFGDYYFWRFLPIQKFDLYIIFFDIFLDYIYYSGDLYPKFDLTLTYYIILGTLYILAFFVAIILYYPTRLIIIWFVVLYYIMSDIIYDYFADYIFCQILCFLIIFGKYLIDYYIILSDFLPICQNLIYIFLNLFDFLANSYEIILYLCRLLYITWRNSYIFYDYIIYFANLYILYRLFLRFFDAIIFIWPDFDLFFLILFDFWPKYNILASILAIIWPFLLYIFRKFYLILIIYYIFWLLYYKLVWLLYILPDLPVWAIII